MDWATALHRRDANADLGVVLAYPYPDGGANRSRRDWAATHSAHHYLFANRWRNSRFIQSYENPVFHPRFRCDPRPSARLIDTIWADHNLAHLSIDCYSSRRNCF